MKTMTIKDSRINRNNDMGGYIRLCNEIIKAHGFNKDFNNSGCKMSFNNFKTTAYKKNYQDFQIDVNLDFNKGIALITIS